MPNTHITRISIGWFSRTNYNSSFIRRSQPRSHSKYHFQKWRQERPNFSNIFYFFSQNIQAKHQEIKTTRLAWRKPSMGALDWGRILGTDLSQLPNNLDEADELYDLLNAVWNVNFIYWCFFSYLSSKYLEK